MQTSLQKYKQHRQQRSQHTEKAHWLPNNSNDVFPTDIYIYCSMWLVVVYWLFASPKNSP